MRYYKYGNGAIATLGELKLEEISFEEYTSVMEQVARRQALSGAVMEKSRPFTADEVTAMLITQQINTLTVDDNTALRMAVFYPEWAANTAYTAGFKVQRNGKLWRCIQSHTAQVGWEPENAASLWEQINETHAGTMDDPIPYEGNMALTAGLYYMQDFVIYRCIRDTINPVYNPLAELVGLYVEVV